MERLGGTNERFAERFNVLFPGAYRRIAGEDVVDMVKCGLIRRHGYFEYSDLQTVRGILQYEGLRGQRLAHSGAGATHQPLGAVASQEARRGGNRGPDRY